MESAAPRWLQCGFSSFVENLWAEFRGRYAYPLTAEVGLGTLESWRDGHEGGVRRFGVTFRRGVPNPICAYSATPRSGR